jgi:murein DD-endopeptidase MepM/ murein hydrolase activator NlpD
MHLQSTVDRLAGLETALSVIPLVVPLNADFHVASGFGRRVDPFTGAPAFHYGLDFVAAFQTPILATSEGIVTYASRLGPYGNLVEIDHGHGIRTRYGHLYRIDVKVGQTVKFHEQVGLLGSTGRSTGPHVHYEIRFNGTLRDPARFLEAGRYVFQG